MDFNHPNEAKEEAYSGPILPPRLEKIIVESLIRVEQLFMDYLIQEMQSKLNKTSDESSYEPNDKDGLREELKEFSRMNYDRHDLKEQIRGLHERFHLTRYLLKNGFRNMDPCPIYMNDMDDHGKACYAKVDAKADKLSNYASFNRAHHSKNKVDQLCTFALPKPEKIGTNLSDQRRTNHTEVNAKADELSRYASCNMTHHPNNKVDQLCEFALPEPENTCTNLGDHGRIDYTEVDAKANKLSNYASFNRAHHSKNKVDQLCTFALPKPEKIGTNLSDQRRTNYTEVNAKADELSRYASCNMTHHPNNKVDQLCEFALPEPENTCTNLGDHGRIDYTEVDAKAVEFSEYASYNRVHHPKFKIDQLCRLALPKPEKIYTNLSYHKRINNTQVDAKADELSRYASIKGAHHPNNKVDQLCEFAFPKLEMICTSLSIHQARKRIKFTTAGLGLHKSSVLLQKNHASSSKTRPQPSLKGGSSSSPNKRRNVGCGKGAASGNSATFAARNSNTCPKRPLEGGTSSSAKKQRNVGRGKGAASGSSATFAAWMPLDTRNVQFKEPYSVEHCLQILDQLPGIDPALHISALGLFENQVWRNKFVTLKHERRFEWLKFMLPNAA